jgi:hypothetical protein
VADRRRFPAPVLAEPLCPGTVPDFIDGGTPDVADGSVRKIHAEIGIAGQPGVNQVFDVVASRRFHRRRLIVKPYPVFFLGERKARKIIDVSEARRILLRYDSHRRQLAIQNIRVHRNDVFLF